MATTNAKRKAEIVVFSVLKPAVCSSCGAEIGKGGCRRREKERRSCLACADLDHLVYLPAGDAALSRRSRKHSTLAAVVVRFSRARKRYERQGLLIELPALEQAEQECLSDQDQRARARERAGLARERTDANYVRAFGEAVRAVYPGRPAAEAAAIAGHACLKYSRRVGRSAAAPPPPASATPLPLLAHA